MLYLAISATRVILSQDHSDFGHLQATVDEHKSRDAPALAVRLLCHCSRFSSTASRRSILSWPLFLAVCFRMWGAGSV
jgi:hypothetical protein